MKELPHIINSINNTPSRPLNDMRPADVNKSNEDEVRLNAYLVSTQEMQKLTLSVLYKNRTDVI
ncbi:hypothetical protein KUTeg_021487 [Tegillarca granosa]|uniref:Uncharacterized protein n=1 Tax=Tegillarca granosa TaxID=220873 RepID=A0ABQ9E9I9_TEGGR|nr:hypothetical protein KUTeg_021487 [Tegillarca granosa]